MRESRLSGSVEGVVCKHDSYSDCDFSTESGQEIWNGNKKGYGICRQGLRILAY